MLSVCLFVSYIYVELNPWPQRTCVGLLELSNIMNKGGLHGARGHYYIHVYHYNDIMIINYQPRAPERAGALRSARGCA